MRALLLCQCMALHASAMLTMQSTTLSYSINYSILKMFNAKLKFMHKYPFIDQHRPCHQHCRRQPPVQDEHLHLVRQDPPAVRISEGSILERCLHVRNGHADNGIHPVDLE